MFTIFAHIYRAIGVNVRSIDMLFFIYADVIVIAVVLLFKFFFDERRK